MGKNLTANYIIIIQGYVLLAAHYLISSTWQSISMGFLSLVSLVKYNMSNAMKLQSSSKMEIL